MSHAFGGRLFEKGDLMICRRGEHKCSPIAFFFIAWAP